MPNYYENHLTITGLREDLIVFRDSAIGNDSEGLNPLCFEKLVPVPEHIAALEEGVCEWTKRHWGTSRDSADTRDYLFCDKEGRGQLVYEFLTGNGDAKGVIEAASANHPRLFFTLIVTGSEGWAALFFAKGGKMAKRYSDYFHCYENAEVLNDLDGEWRFVPFVP
jgi:hypothetical protein